MKKARLIFVDMPVHDESVNYIPYNLAFMLNDKDKYFILRRKLTQLALKETSPTEEQIKALAEQALKMTGRHKARHREVHIEQSAKLSSRKTVRIEKRPSPLPTV